MVMWILFFSVFVTTLAAISKEPIRPILNGEQLRTTTPLTSKIGMYDGTKTTIKKHPYIVSIMYEDYLYCAGTIVSESWVVTIKGCADSVDIDKYSVVAGTNDGFTGKVFRLSQVIINENSGVGLFDYSYTCIQIQGKFKFNKKMQTVTLPRNPPPSDTVFTVAGYGATQPVYLGQNWMLEGDMKWLDTQQCEYIWQHYAFSWSERMTCAYNKGKTTLCTGDFGDGFVKDGVFYGQFVGSVGTEGWCNSKALPNILANIAPLSDWIKNITGAQYEDERKH